MTQAGRQGFSLAAKVGIPATKVGGPATKDLLRVVRLSPVMELACGKPEIVIGLIDGPVATTLPTLATENIRETPHRPSGSCTRSDSVACSHGTFVAGMLLGRRDSFAPAICPGCTLHLRTIFAETTPETTGIPSAAAEELAAAILDCIRAGASVINLSLALVDTCSGGQRELKDALDESARRGVLVVAASGNQREIGSTAITSHPWVVPVVACDLTGRALPESNLGRSIGIRGLTAPGEGIESIGPDGNPLRMSGSSAAAPFVTGAISLLWSAFISARATDIRMAVLQGSGARRTTVVPPLLDAWAAYQALAAAHSRRS